MAGGGAGGKGRDCRASHVFISWPVIIIIKAPSSLFQARMHIGWLDNTVIPKPVPFSFMTSLLDVKYKSPFKINHRLVLMVTLQRLEIECKDPLAAAISGSVN